jgi:hypothetical protein
MDDNSASADADRAVVNGAASVSALRASVPSAGDQCDWCGGSPIRDNLDGDDLCQQCCDKWVRAEGHFADAGKADQ